MSKALYAGARTNTRTTLAGHLFGRNDWTLAGPVLFTTWRVIGGRISPRVSMFAFDWAQCSFSASHPPARAKHTVAVLAACDRRTYAKRGSDWALTIMGGWHPRRSALKNETAALDVLSVSFILGE